MENFEILSANIVKDLKEKLSEYRYNHSLSVAKKAKELAIIYNEDPDEAYLAGLLHDNSKELSDEEMLKEANRFGLDIDEIEKRVPALLHGRVGAEIAKEKYNINDNIFYAIAYHVLTDKKMNTLAKIIYVADKTEDNRESNIYNIDKERELSRTDLDGAMLLITEAHIESQLKRQRLVHPRSMETRNYILMNRTKED
jgi:nicotinate-nucleotide adenylyltransferase